MQEFAFLGLFKDDPMSAVWILIIILGYRGLEALFKFLFMKKKKAEANSCGGIQAIHEEKLKNIEDLLYEDASKREERIVEVDKRFDLLEGTVNKVLSIIADLEIASSKTSQGTLENMLFNNNTPIFRQLKAFRRLIAMGKNGRIRERGYDLIKNNKERWRDVVDLEMDLKIVNQKYYDDVMADIERRILN
jgi:hypothetical protein